MTVRTVNNLPTATHGETARCLFAIELSKKSWVIGFITPLAEKISRRTLKGCDWKGLLSCSRKCEHVSVARRVGLPRDNQGETAASIRMRMRRGWTDGARA